MLQHLTSCGGRAIIDRETKSVKSFTVLHHRLIEKIRTPLGLDRVRATILDKAQQEYLQRRIPNLVIEPDPKYPTAFLCTFSITERQLVEKVIKHWKELSAVTLQKVWRGTSGRLMLFSKMKKEVNNLKGKAKGSIDKNNFEQAQEICGALSKRKHFMELHEPLISRIKVERLSKK